MMAGILPVLAGLVTGGVASIYPRGHMTRPRRDI